MSARLIWGTYQSYQLCVLLFGANADKSVGSIKFLYAGINIMLNGLNFFWFRSMVNALLKRYVSDPATKRLSVADSARATRMRSTRCTASTGSCRGRRTRRCNEPGGTRWQ